ncbi:MAG: CsgG/HfaB family protein [Rhodothermales bacterium]
MPPRLLRPSVLRAALLGLLVSLGACVTDRALTPDDYRDRLPALEARVAQSPQDVDALVALGEARAQAGHLLEAHEPLDRALALQPQHPKALYYRGVVSEGLGRRDEALGLYARYEGIARTSPYRRLMAGRHAWLLRLMVRDELSALLAAEDSLAGVTTTEAVAVFPFTYRGSDEQYRPIGRGLSEMVTEDLAAVERIRVVERIRLHVLLDELDLAQGGAFDAATAPRLGRILRSGRVVGGTVTVEDEAIQSDVGLWVWERDALPDLNSREADLADLFRHEKEIVFGIIDGLGIELTDAERERVERIPTRNLQAFLSYSRGLMEEDAGNFAGAAELFGRAATLDPGFTRAAENAQQARTVASVAGPVTNALDAGRSTRGDGSKLVGTRLSQLTDDLGAHLVSEWDTRTLVVESITVTVGEPPPPPPSGN